MRERSTSGKARLPVAEALTTAGILVRFGEAIDPSTTAGHERRHMGHQRSMVPGEQVCAVQYRKVQFKWYSSRELRDQPLGPNKWKTYWTFGGQTDDVVEVDLQDHLELEDEEANHDSTNAYQCGHICDHLGNTLV